MQENNSDDDDYEYVSAETVQDMIVWTYKVALRLSFLLNDVTTLHNIKITLKTSVALVIVWQLSNCMSDAVFLWLLTNIVIAWPLVYLKK